MNNIKKILAVSSVFILLAGCAGYHAQKVGTTTMIKAQGDIPEDRLLDVGIQVFASDEVTEAQSEKEMTSTEIRTAESHFIPYHLKNTLQQSSYWGAVRVLPVRTEGIDVLVSGKILASNGEHLVLQVDVVDATGKTWFSKTYESEATATFYSGNQAGEKDAYQDLYNAICNDMTRYRMQLSPKSTRNIRTVSKLKFTEDLVPSAYSGYLAKDEKGVITVNRLPADDDPMITRSLKVRKREQMYVDTLNEYYEEYYNEMWPSYEDWRELNQQELMAIKKIKRDALMRKITGALLVAGAIALNAGDIDYTGALQASMIIIGSQVIIDGFNISKQAEIHSAAIKELSDSFGSEMQPVVMEFEGKKVELTGSAEAQFNQWRELLRKIYITETGFDPDEAATGFDPDEAATGFDPDEAADGGEE
ncbi:MAG: hypothetical protein JRF27_05225 [Deltaproteobacteria bacterium]|nr:hypothetical protein [Deltaproteobacteria bacterium]